MDSLLAHIEVAFAKRAAPRAGELTRCTYDRANGGDFNGPCLECQSVARFFGGRDWREIGAAALAVHGQCDHLLSIAAYCYYLPAYLVASVREPRVLDVCVDHLAYRFGPRPGDDWAIERRQAVLCELSEEERRVLLDYFCYALDRDGDFDDFTARSIEILRSFPNYSLKRTDQSLRD